MEEDGRARLAVELLDDRVGECRVDGGVALLPGGRRSRSGLVLELPQAVLDEPEGRIGDDVVVEVVGDGVVRDEPQPVARAVAAVASTGPSAATTRSSSESALAIQVTS